MAVKIFKPLALSTVILMAACSGESDQTPKESVSQDQVETIDKARDVEKMLHNSSKKQREAIGEL